MSGTFGARVPSNRVTPRGVFFARRKFLSLFGVSAMAGAGWLSAVHGEKRSRMLEPPLARPDLFPATRNPAYHLPSSLERRQLTPREVAASHNNFYEFLPGQGGPVWKYADEFEVEPWKVKISGQCHKPMTLDLDDLFGFEQEERIYHFRCVERWAMNVPWTGFELRKLLERVEPKSSAKYVRFISAYRLDQMPGAKRAPSFPWPYHEGLRMDEAMNPLTLVVTGVYGEPLLKQHGAPVRIIVPWKYGYKSPKSIVKIELLKKQPKIFWEILPHEYGFFSNVNPNIPHPRWSQAKSYWLDTREWFPTPIFNGYDQDVASLYPDEPRTLQRVLRKGQKAR